MDDFLGKLNNLLDEVDDNIKSIKEITSKNHRLLEIIFGRDSSIRDIVKEHNELDFIESSVGSDQWRLYQHRSVVTQLYAIYEDFVEKLISIWIDNLPNIFDKYSDLGIDFQKQYILGIAKLMDFCNFIQAFCLSLHDLIIYRTVERMIEIDKVVNLGKIRQYRNQLKSSRLKVNNVSLSLGATVFLVNENTSICKQAKIISITDSQNIPKNSIKIDMEKNILLQFNIEAKKNWLVYLLKT